MNKQLILATITCANISTQGHTSEEGASNDLSVVVEHMATSISSLTKTLYDLPKQVQLKPCATSQPMKANIYTLKTLN
jgi:hypothetical protein